MAAEIPVLDRGLAEGASDWTVCAGQPLTLRVGDSLKFHDVIDAETFGSLVAAMAPDAKNEDVGGFTYQGERFRFIAYDALDGRTLEIRHLPKKLRTLDELGVPDAFRRSVLGAQRGLFVVTGATGSGKSTTLAGALHLISTTQPLKIITLEDPIEYVHPSSRSLVKQREFGKHFHSFADAIKAAMRQDPDVIMVGEMRDLETMRAAITAAETGHVVFGTMHTASAPGAISRILDSSPGAETLAKLASSLVGVLAQQLVPTLAGGRCAVFEYLTTNTAVANCIREHRVEHLRDEIGRGGHLGMTTMDMSLEMLVRKRVIAKAVAIERCHDPKTLTTKLANLT